MRKLPEHTSRSSSRDDPTWRKIVAENSDVDDAPLEDDADRVQPVKHNINSAEKTRRANNALRYHASFGDTEKVQQALSDGASLDPLDSEGNTAAHYCVKNGHPDCLNILLAEGFDLDVYGRKVVKTAVQKLISLSEENNTELERGILACLEILKVCGATTNEDIKSIEQEFIDELREKNARAFSQAIDAINDDAKDDLLTLIPGINVNDVDSHGKMLAEYAIDLGHIDCLDCLLNNGVDITLHGARLMLHACQLADQHQDESDSSINYRACVELLQAAGAPCEIINPAVQKESPRPLPDFELERQEREQRRSRAGQESETELICSFSPGVFFTAGGYKRPRFFVIDPIIRSWNVNKMECSAQFDGSMEINDNTSEVKIAPRGLCKAGDDLLAVNYGSHVQLIRATTKEVVEKIDLTQSFIKSSPRLSFTPKSPRKGSIRLLSPRKEIPSQPIAITTSPADRSPPPKHSPRALVPETKRRTTLSASSKSQVPVIKTADMCTIPQENNLLVTSTENEIKIWDIHHVICKAVYSDKRSGSLQKILALNNQRIFGLDEKNNIFIWDPREKGATKAAVFIEGVQEKCDPCVATFGDENLIAIGYRGDNGRGQDYPRVLDLRIGSLIDIEDESTKFTLQGATFCSMGNGTLAVASKKLVHHNYPIRGKDNLVQGKLVSVYTPANHKLKFVDIFTQEKEDPSRSLPRVVTMQKVDENVVALGLCSEKGPNTLKLSRTNTHEYQWENAKEESVVLRPQFK